MYRFMYLVLFAAVSAEVIYNGPCPEVRPKEDFDFYAYQGTWYEIARYPNAAEEGTKGKCTIAEYLVYGSTGKVQNSHVINNVRSFINGELTLVGPGKVMFTYTFNGISKNSFLTILDTDYQTYSIGYSCKYFPTTNTHQVFSWIKSRSPVMDMSARSAVDNYLSQSTILDVTKYVANNYSPDACFAPLARAITQFL